MVFDLGNNEHLVQQKQAEVLFAGAVPDSTPFLLQVKVRVSADTVDTGSAVPCALFIGSHWTVFQVTIAFAIGGENSIIWRPAEYFEAEVSQINRRMPAGVAPSSAVATKRSPSRCS